MKNSSSRDANQRERREGPLERRSWKKYKIKKIRGKIHHKPLRGCGTNVLARGERVEKIGGCDCRPSVKKKL